MNPLRVFLQLHKTLRGAQAAHRRRRGKEPTQLPWEGKEDTATMTKWLLNFLMQTAFKGYRRQIGIALMGASLTLHYVICNPDLAGAVPAFASACSSVGPTFEAILAGVGGWAGLAGWIGKPKAQVTPPPA